VHLFDARLHATSDPTANAGVFPLPSDCCLRRGRVEASGMRIRPASSG